MFGKHKNAKYNEIPAASAGTPLSPITQATLQDEELTELARLELEEHNKLRNELLLSGSEGSATVLSIFEMGVAVPPLVGYVVDVEVKPLFGGPRFTRSLAIWIDPRTNTITDGGTVQVRYDPQDTSRIIIQ